MNEIDEEEGSAGPANVTSGVATFSPKLGLISRIKHSDNKRKKKRKKKKMKKKTLREILEQSTPPLPIKREKAGVAAFAASGLKPAAKRAAEKNTKEAIKRTYKNQEKSENQGGVPDPKTDPELFYKFQNELKKATSKLGKPESSPVNDAIKNASMKDKDAEQKKPNDMRR